MESVKTTKQLNLKMAAGMKMDKKDARHVKSLSIMMEDIVHAVMYN